MSATMRRWFGVGLAFAIAAGSGVAAAEADTW